MVDARLGEAAGVARSRAGDQPARARKSPLLSIPRRYPLTPAGGISRRTRPLVPAAGSTRDPRRADACASRRSATAALALGGKTVPVPTLLAADDEDPRTSNGTSPGVERASSWQTRPTRSSTRWCGGGLGRRPAGQAADAPPAPGPGWRRSRRRGAGARDRAVSSWERGGGRSDRVDAIDALSVAAEHATDVGDFAGAATLDDALPPSSRRPTRSARSCCTAATRGRDRAPARGGGDDAAMAATVASRAMGSMPRRISAHRSALGRRTTLDGARAIASGRTSEPPSSRTKWGLACRGLAGRSMRRGHAAVVDDLSEAAQRARASGHPTRAARALRGRTGAQDGPLPSACGRTVRAAARPTRRDITRRAVAGILAVLPHARTRSKRH
jgi:hypothetical protein